MTNGNTARLIAAACALAVQLAAGAAAQTETDRAIAFFRAGGAYCFRLAPEGVALGEEQAWTVMLLTSAANSKTRFRIRTVDPGATRMSGDRLSDASVAVTAVWRLDRTRTAFFEQFAAGIADGSLRARVVTLAPPGLDRMTLAQRADAYLKFADRGSTVAFDEAPDLGPEAWLAYGTYVPD